MPQENESSSTYSAAALWALLLPFSVAGLLAVAAGILLQRVSTPQIFSDYAHIVSYLVPSIEKISVGTPDESRSAVLLALQWSFAPLYFVVWILKFPPWGDILREATRQKSLQLKTSQRVLFVCGYLFLVAYLMADAGIIDMATIYNAKFAYPISNAIPFLRAIYGSSVILSIYGWLSSFIEPTLIWLLVFFTTNFRIYLNPGKPLQRT
jgi:hypothetical protein